MIITRTPLRISLFGGSTDFFEWYMNNKEGGLVLSSSIDKYTYVMCKNIPDFIPYNYRIVYNRKEEVKNVGEIKNDIARECIKLLEPSKLEVIYTADLPSSGVSTSSSFTVGLLKAIYGLYGEDKDNVNIAFKAIHIEQDKLKLSCGSQDQLAVAIGGMNEIRFKNDGNIDYVPIDKEISEELNKHILLFYMGKRTETNIEKDKIKNIKKRAGHYKSLYLLAKDAISDIKKKDFSKIGEMLDYSWELKKGLSDKVSNNKIDNIYDLAKGVGAIGGKIMGSGGGGFMFFWVDDLSKKDYIMQTMKPYLEWIPFSFEHEGCKIIYREEKSRW